jgi:ankyrin repeat protein
MAMARVLLERGADPNAVTRMGNVPLADAVRDNRIEYVKLLLEFGVSKFSVLLISIVMMPIRIRIQLFS